MCYIVSWPCAVKEVGQVDIFDISPTSISSHWINQLKFILKLQISGLYCKAYVGNYKFVPELFSSFRFRLSV